MLLIAGLGNPGAQYAHNRHNIGFLSIDTLAQAYNATHFRKKFQGEIAEFTHNGEKILLLKPQTYMNKSGTSIYEAAQFYKIPLANIIIFYDDLDLPAGKLRMKTGGGSAGHNGIRSIIQHIGEGFRRARLGIGHPGKEKVLSHVLGDFSKADETWLNPFLQSLTAHAPFLFSGEDDRYQTAIHNDMQQLEEG